jgi:hypothetical protein
MGMKVHMKIIVFTVLAALITGCSSTYLVRGEGGTACATVKRQVQDSEQARIVYGAWLAGYVTRYNYERDTKLSKDYQSDTLMDAALEYCSGKPLDDFSQAAEAVITELRRKN